MMPTQTEYWEEMAERIAEALESIAASLQADERGGMQQSLDRVAAAINNANPL